MSQIKALRLAASKTLTAKVYLLQPFENPAKKAVDSRRVFEGELKEQQIDFSSSF